MAYSRSKYVKFIGKSVYSMLYRPDEYNGDEFWKQGLAVTKQEAEKIKNSGCQAKPKVSGTGFTPSIPNIDDGSIFFTFKRPTSRKDKQTEEVKWNYCPPYITNKKGKNLVHYELKDKQVQSYSPDDDRPDRVGEPFLIGNGSDIEVTVEIYDAKPYGKGSRLASVRVIDLIEYNPADEEEETVEVGEEKSDDEVRAEIQKSRDEIRGDAPFISEEMKAEEKAVSVSKKSKVGW